MHFQTKDKELDLAKLNQKEAEKKVKDAEEAFMLKAKVITPNVSHHGEISDKFRN